ncbi:MAG: gliding motility protein GldL [Bacteroidetes bacterium]|nr:gliding motility protein GldL [Bacteroidota bacterium]
MSSKLPKITGYKKTLHIAACVGSAVVIVGALFKIQHYPGAALMLIVGLLTEAAIFLLYAFDIPHEDYDWSLAYPELTPGMGGHTDDEDDKLEGATVTQQLDSMLEQAKIGPELIESLGNSMRSLSDNASKIADISNAHTATNEYVNSVKGAAKNVSSLSDSYSKAAESLMGLSLSNETGTSFGEQLSKVSKNLSALNASYELQLQGSNEHLKATSQFYEGLENLMKNLNDSVEDTRKYKTEISALSSNLTALNGIYGNMLSAMNYKQH